MGKIIELTHDDVQNELAYAQIVSRSLKLLSAM